MGCPVRKVRRTGAGAELLREPELALALARGAVEGSGLPVTVKLRSGIEAGDRSGFELAVRLAEEAGVAAIGFHPRAATIGHKGSPDYVLTRELVERVEVPVIVSGGLEERRGRAPRLCGVGCRGGDDRPRLTRQSLGLRGTHRTALAPPDRDEVAAELLWVIDRAEEHLGTERAGATCASSTPGTWSHLALQLSLPTSSSARRPAASASLDRQSEPLQRPRYNPATSGPGAVRQTPPHLGVFGSRSRLRQFSIH